MTTDDNTPTPSSGSDPKQAAPGQGRRRRRRWLMLTGLPLLALGSAFAAKALADHHGHGFGRGHGFHSAKTVDELRERMAHRADRVLGYLDATDSQRREIDAIIDTHAPQLFALKSEGKQLHQQMFDAVRSGDPLAIEAARKAGITHFDAASKVWVQAAALAYDVLDADQKAEVMEHFERFGPAMHGHGH